MFAFRKTREMTWYTFGNTPNFNEDGEFFNITFCYYKPISMKTKLFNKIDIVSKCNP